MSYNLASSTWDSRSGWDIYGLALATPSIRSAELEYEKLTFNVV